MDYNILRTFQFLPSSHVILSSLKDCQGIEGTITILLEDKDSQFLRHIRVPS